VASHAPALAASQSLLGFARHPTDSQIAKSQNRQIAKSQNLQPPSWWEPVVQQSPAAHPHRQAALPATTRPGHMMAATSQGPLVAAPTTYERQALQAQENQQNPAKSCVL